MIDIEELKEQIRDALAKMPKWSWNTAFVMLDQAVVALTILEAERDEAKRRQRELQTEYNGVRASERKAVRERIAAEADAASWKADAAVSHLRVKELLDVARPISFEDVRLVSGGGKISGPAVVFAVNIILERRAQAALTSGGEVLSVSQGQPGYDGERAASVGSEPSAADDRKRCHCRYCATRTPDNRCGHCGLPISGKLLRAERKRARRADNAKDGQ